SSIRALAVMVLLSSMPVMAGEVESVHSGTDAPSLFFSPQFATLVDAMKDVAVDSHVPSPPTSDIPAGGEAVNAAPKTANQASNSAGNNALIAAGFSDAPLLKEIPGGNPRVGEALIGDSYGNGGVASTGGGNGTLDAASGFYSPFSNVGAVQSTLESL